MDLFKMVTFAFCFWYVFFSSTAKASSLPEVEGAARDGFTYVLPKGVWVAAALRRLGVKDPWLRSSWAERVVRENPDVKTVEHRFTTQTKIRIPIEIRPPEHPKRPRFRTVMAQKGQSLSEVLIGVGISKPFEKFSYAIQVLVANGLKVEGAKVMPGMKLKVPMELWPGDVKEKPKSSTSVASEKPEKEKKKKDAILVGGKEYKVPSMEPSFNIDYGSDRTPASEKMIYSYKAHHLYTSIEHAFHQFSKTGLVDTEFSSVMARVSYRNLIAPPFWHFDLDAKMTVQTFAKQDNSVDIQFLDVNLRGGLAIPWIPEPWRLTVLAGIYYSKVTTNNSSFGYTPVGFVQIYPELRRLFPNGDSLTAYLRYSPTGNNPFRFSADEQASALGLKWIRPWRVPIGLGVEYSTLRFRSRSTDRQISSSALNINLGFGF